LARSFLSLLDAFNRSGRSRNINNSSTKVSGSSEASAPKASEPVTTITWPEPKSAAFLVDSMSQISDINEERAVVGLRPLSQKEIFEQEYMTNPCAEVPISRPKKIPTSQWVKDLYSQLKTETVFGSDGGIVTGNFSNDLLANQKLPNGAKIKDLRTAIHDAVYDAVVTYGFAHTSANSSPSGLQNIKVVKPRVGSGSFYTADGKKVTRMAPLGLEPYMATKYDRKLYPPRLYDYRRMKENKLPNGKIEVSSASIRVWVQCVHDQGFDTFFVPLYVFGVTDIKSSTEGQLYNFQHTLNELYGELNDSPTWQRLKKFFEGPPPQQTRWPQLGTTW